MPAPEIERQPPHDKAAEGGLLASLLIGGGLMAQCAGMLRPGDFYTPEYRAVYTAMLSLHNAGVEVDRVTLEGEIDRTGADAFLSILPYEPSPGLWEHYAKRVQAAALYRRAIATTERMNALAWSAPLDAEGALAEWDRLAQSVREGMPAEGPRLITDVFNDLFSDLDGEHSGGIATRMAGIDGMLGGLRGGDLIALAARTGQGKSAFATCIAKNAALGQGRNVLLFSLEMGEMQVAERLLAQVARVDAQDLRLRRLEADDWARVVQAAGQFTVNAAGSIWVDETGGLDIATVRARAQQVQMKHGLDLVIVDYLQLVAGQGENRVQELSAVARGLKNMAKALRVPVLACAQFNRQAENLPDETPRMGWIEGSGEIEKASDIVMMLHVPDRRNAKDRYECIIAKHRGGPVGVVNLNWDAKTVTFWTEDEVF